VNIRAALIALEKIKTFGEDKNLARKSNHNSSDLRPAA